MLFVPSGRPAPTPLSCPAPANLHRASPGSSRSFRIPQSAIAFRHARPLTPRLPGDPRLLRRRVAPTLRPRTDHVAGALHEEATGREIFGHDLHEVVHPYARVVRGGHLAARRTRALPLAARRAARTRRADRRHRARALA